MSTRTTRGNIFRDLGKPEEVAENLVIRSQLMHELQRTIKHRGLTQKQAAGILEVEQSRLSNLMTGRISLFSIDTLVNMAVRIGLQVTITVAEPATVPSVCSQLPLNETGTAETTVPARALSGAVVRKSSRTPEKRSINAQHGG